LVVIAGDLSLNNNNIGLVGLMQNGVEFVVG